METIEHQEKGETIVKAARRSTTFKGSTFRSRGVLQNTKKK